MNRRHFLTGLAAAATVVASMPLSQALYAADLAPGLSAELFKTLDGIVDNAMAAYNAGDWRKFYADYAKALAATETEGAFSALYTNGYKKTFGNFKSKTLWGKKTSFPGPVGLLVYNAQMEKGSAELDINFMKEGDSYKIQQIQFNKRQIAT